MTIFPPARWAALGRIFFGAAVVFFGLQHFLEGKFVTRAMPPWPRWVPGLGVWTYVVGALLILAGGAMIFRGGGRRAATLVASLFLVSAVLLHLPALLAQIAGPHLWANAGKGFALGAGALLVASTFPREAASPTDRFFVVCARIALGGFMILAGIQHLLYVEFVRHLVPAWVPGAVFWTYFSAATLILGGAAMAAGFRLRLVALLTALMIFLWVLMLHIPRALAAPQDANEATAVFEALAFTGVALMLAAKAGAPASRAPAST